MAITSLGANDTGATSRTVINNNFTELDTTKADLASPTFTGSPVLPSGTTGVTQSASDNSTKLATTEYVDTAVGAGGASCLTIIPLPNGGTINTIGSISVTTNTTAYISQVSIPYSITVNKISFGVGSVTTPDTIDLTLYSENGQTRLFSVTSATVSASSIITVSVPSVSLTPGIYYIMANANNTVSCQLYDWEDATTPFSALGVNILGDVASEPIMRGTLTITAGTPPATITPTAITEGNEGTLIFRLDN